MEIPDECDLLNDSYEGCKLLPPIRSQHNALICWAFMMVNLVEAMYTRTFKSRRLLSVQELFDSVHPRAPVCDIYGSYGMKHDELFDWVKKYGISLDAYYPYKGFRNDPQKCQPGLPRVGIKSYTYMDPNVDEVAIMRKLSEGIPLCASIIVYLEEFSYLIHDKEKIYRGVEGPRLYTDPLDGAGHSVLLIGYGGSGEDKYWKIQNSHGENWGIKGVGKILRGNYARNVEGEEINLLRDVFACEVCKR